MEPERVDAEGHTTNKIKAPAIILRWFDRGVIFFLFKLFNFNFIASPEGKKKQSIAFFS